GRTVEAEERALSRKVREEERGEKIEGRKEQRGVAIDIDEEERAAARTDFEWARKLQQAVDEEREKHIREKMERVALRGVLENIGEGTTPKVLFNAITRADLPNDQRLDLLRQVPNLISGGETEDALRDIPIFNKDGPLGDLPVPESIHRLSQPAQDAWFKERGFEDLTTKPTAKAPVERLTADALKRLVETGIIDQTLADKQAAGFIDIAGPDATGRYAIIDKATNKVTFRGGGKLSKGTLDLIDRRVLAINDALLLLRRSDLSSVGIDQILKAEVGGIALQIPVIGSIAEALGLNPEEVNEIQADRSIFFSVLRPLAASFAVGGSRQNQGTKIQIELAKRMSNMIRFSSTPGGAEMSRNQLSDILTEIKNNLVAQRISENAIPPSVARVDWFFDENGEMQFRVLE
ncbi:hypothetical protein LCGC14_2609800, partial [marine sediment metagenome]